MADYTLYYWPLPFRGAFIKSLLALADSSWDQPAPDEVKALMQDDPDSQPVPHMAPPVLVDHETDVALSQMPAILGYLARKHGLCPADPAQAALTDKLVADANDVLYEITLHNGAQMWTPEMWSNYRPRLARWMSIFEQIGQRHGLTPERGYLLGSDAPGLADVVVLNLWGVMTQKLLSLRPMLDETAPAIAGLADRMAERPEQAALLQKAQADHGDEWCGGQIEKSLRAAM
ncbi:glutathione S-transferase [Palleronia sp.]|uniref:glutathione S-transferase n=1 Tax=Palleronia sp. TaxID=1940284 RepID=UPI0035C86360